MCFVCRKGSFINRNEAQATAVNLEAHLHQAKAELQSAQENSIITGQKISSALHEWTNELEKAVEDLEQKNVELSRCSVDILLQYQQGNVVRSFWNAFALRLTLVQTDIEKGFVAYIMKQTRDIHEPNFSLPIRRRRQSSVRADIEKDRSARQVDAGIAR